MLNECVKVTTGEHVKSITSQACYCALKIAVYELYVLGQSKHKTHFHGGVQDLFFSTSHFECPEVGNDIITTCG